MYEIDNQYFFLTVHDKLFYVCRSLNKDLKKNRIGVMLALAILTQFFYSWNQRKSHTQTKKGAIPPTISPTERKISDKRSISADKGETFGIGIGKKMHIAEENESETSQQTNISQEDIMNILYQKIEHDVRKDEETTQEQDVNLTEESLSYILYRSISMLRLGEKICNLSKSSSFNFRDLGFMDDVVKALHCALGSDGSGGDEHERRLESVLKSKGFVKFPVQGDGDCLLTASFLQIQRLLHSEGVSMLSNHLNCIGLLPTTDISEAVPKLRKLMVAEWLENEDDYGLRNLCGNEHDIFEYEESGVFGGALGDAMPLALANVLHLPIVIFTSIANFPLITVSPRQQLPNAQPLCLAYTQQGPGHYDIATLQQANSTSTPQETDREGTTSLLKALPTLSCRCGQGRDRKDLSKTRCQIPPGRFSCRCECFNTKVACSASCQCNNCGNSYGQRPATGSGDMKQARKRAKHDAQFKHQTSLSFMKERGERVRLGGWTDMEHCVFVQVLKHLEDTTESVTMTTLFHVYNSLVDLIKRSPDLGSILLAEKSEKEVGAKYTQHCKEAALIKSLLNSNNDNN